MLRSISAQHDDDLSDRMNYLFTSNILLAASLLISFKQFGGRPVECMFPFKFPKSWEQYAENYCWSQDTYFVPPDQHVETLSEEQRSGTQFSYYQWVPFFLIFQAACFRLPSMLWNYLSTTSGIRIREVVERAMDASNMDETVRLKNVDVLVRHLKCALRFQRRMTRRNILIHKTIKILNLTYAPSFISTMYLFTKLLYLINVVLQLFLMNKFLETDKYEWYGLGLIKDIMNGTRWENSGAFPRVSVCDFTVRQVANIQKYSVQCVLVINIFNEKIFILLWFWYTAVLLLTIYSVFYWVIIMAFPCCGRWFVSQNLEMSEMKFNGEKQKKQVTKFVNEYLRADGVFVLRMIAMHAGVIFGTDLVLALWKVFYGLENAALDQQTEESRSGDSEDNNNKSNFLRRRKKKQLKENAYDMESLNKRMKNKGSYKEHKYENDTLETTLLPIENHYHGKGGRDSRASQEEKDERERREVETNDKRFSTEDPRI
ncbi:hypothetical protein L596_012761 [Steinernema carpocapsae]|uniref:Innexin n=1 Tax=Steinernema carpocapsae TaxID=34508 RepID=A0A4U5NZ08_STECR|nr:hypothetical protein L596_012761 [Steinernema carpocapsae]